MSHSSASARGRLDAPQPIACKPSPPQFVPNAVSFEEVNLVDPSSSDEEEASPPEPPKPRGARLCPTCGRTCSHAGTLNKHMKEVHSDTTFRCRRCPRMYKTKSNRVKHEKTCVNSPSSLARKPGSQ